MYKFKGTELSSKGIIVEKKPTISKGKKKIEVFDIPGRNGFLSVDSGVYEPFELTLECHLDTSVANLDEVKALLDGYGTLQFDNDRQYTAIVNNAIPFEVVATKFRSFQIQFLVNPIAESPTPTQVEITSNPYTLAISDTYSTIYPIISIVATTDMTITINDTTFTLKALSSAYTYRLDCKNQVITYGPAGSMVNASDRMSGDFPTLKNGNNTISYTGTTPLFYIYYRKTYL